METGQIRDVLEGTLTRQQEMIRAADSRISPLLAIDTGLLGSAAALAPAWSDWPSYAIVVGLLTGVLLLLSLIFLCLVTFPRTQAPKDSLVYFDTIQAQSKEQYMEKLKTLSEAEYVSDLAYQSHRNAEIAAVKFRHLRESMLALLLAVPCWIVLIYLLYQAGKR